MIEINIYLQSIIGAIIPRVSVLAEIKEENSENVRLKCSWNSTGNLKNVEYQVQWFGDLNETLPKIQKNFNGLDEFLFHPFHLDAKRGYKFNKHVSCAWIKIRKHHNV